MQQEKWKNEAKKKENLETRRQNERVHKKKYHQESDKQNRKKEKTKS